MADAFRVFQFSAGRMVRQNVLSAVRAGALAHGVGFEYVERKGFFESDYACRVTGSEAAVAGFWEAYKDYLRRLNDDG